MPACVILAAGKGARMNSDRPKVLSEVLFYPMLGWVFDTVISCNIQNICIVVGHKHEMVLRFLNREGYICNIAMQHALNGTAHAVTSASSFWKNYIDDDILILNGDSPFISPNAIMDAYKAHKSGNLATVISSNIKNPSGYGRIIRDVNNSVIGIIEEKEATFEQKNITEINSGTYWFKCEILEKFLSQIKKNSGEFYLTSLIGDLIKNNLKVGIYKTNDSNSVLGANNPEQLEILNQIAKNKIIETFKSKGVYIPDENNVTIGKNVEIGEGTTILSDVTILGKVKIGRDCVIGPGTNIFSGDFPDNTSLIFCNTNLYDQERFAV
ncbi:MAG: NTP transferase domain-containing protein [Oscillospiraceae bacterium]|nr:NTP transferase domain-containing protein [Oscillospiraceae bacterium]